MSPPPPLGRHLLTLYLYSPYEKCITFSLFRSLRSASEKARPGNVVEIAFPSRPIPPLVGEGGQLLKKYIHSGRRNFYPGHKSFFPFTLPRTSRTVLAERTFPFRQHFWSNDDLCVRFCEDLYNEKNVYTPNIVTYATTYVCDINTFHQRKFCCMLFFLTSRKYLYYNINLKFVYKQRLYLFCTSAKMLSLHQC